MGDHTATMVSDYGGFAELITPLELEMLGGPRDVTGRAAATKFTTIAQEHHYEAVPTTEYPDPETGRVRFYLLCYGEVRTIDADADALAKGMDKCSDLWAAGQSVLAELRLVKETRREDNAQSDPGKSG